MSKFFMVIICKSTNYGRKIRQNCTISLSNNMSSSNLNRVCCCCWESFGIKSNDSHFRSLFALEVSYRRKFFTTYSILTCFPVVKVVCKYINSKASKNVAIFVGHPVYLYFSLIISLLY